MDEKEKEILMIIKELKEAYKKYYALKIKKKYTLNKRTDCVEAWRKVADIVYKIKANPEEYIRANFKYRKDPHIPVNTLHGPTAQKCYRRAQMLSDTGGTQEKEESTLEQLPPSRIDILSRIADLQSYLVYNKKSNNLTDPATRQYVLTRIPGLLDPLAVMLMSPDKEMKAVYGEAAKAILDEEPCLKEAIKELDLTAALEYILEPYAD